MAARALCFILALCTVQVSQAQQNSFFNLTAAVNSLTNAADMLKLNAETSFNSTLESIDSRVNAEVSRLTDNYTSTANDASAEIQKLVQKANDKGIDAGDCGIDAAANITKINVGLPFILRRCYTDNMVVFKSYMTNIENDISESYKAIKDAVSASAKCRYLDYLVCNTNIFLNATNFEQTKAADVGIQLANSVRAGDNAVAAISACDKEKTTQAILGVQNAVTGTKNCIAAKKPVLTSTKSSDTSTKSSDTSTKSSDTSTKSSGTTTVTITSTASMSTTSTSS